MRNWNILGVYFTPTAPAVPKAVKQERGKALSALNKARKLAEDTDIEIDKDSAGGWWVTCSTLKPDPMEGNHFCSDGTEVLEAVRFYISNGAAKVT